jgi:two-component system response regulator HydG
MRRRILLIEDDQDTAQTLAQCLPCFDVDGALTFREATWKLFSQKERPYSAVVLDLRLPDGEGPVLANKLHTTWPQIPIVVVTGMSDHDAPSVALHHAGVECVLRKPIDPADLRAALIDVIAPREAKQEYEPLRRDAAEAKSFMEKAQESSANWTNRPLRGR